MDKCLIYSINRDYLTEKGKGLCDIIKRWLNSKGVDALVYDFIVDDNANIIIDYEFDDNIDSERLRQLVEIIFKEFNIKVTLEEN